MNKKKILLKGLEYALYLAVAYFVYSKLKGNLSELNLSDINPLYLILSILIYSFHGLWNGFAWNYLMKESGESTDLKQQMDVYLRSYLMRYIPGNIVGIMARGLLNKKYGVPMIKSLWGWFFENILYLGLGVLLGSYAILIGSAIDSQLIFIAMIFAVFVGVFFIVKNEILETIFIKLLVPRVKKLKPTTQSEFVPLRIKLPSRVMLLGMYAISWLIYSVSFLLAVKATGIDLAGNVFILVSANALAYSAGYLSIITPSGAGVRESVMIVILTTVVGLSSASSVIIAISARVVFILGELLGVAAYYLITLFNKKNE